MDEARLPTGLWIEAHLHQLTIAGTPFYILHTGNHASGVVMLKLNGRHNGCGLLIQQRDLDGVLGWTHALGEETVEESKIDAYIERAVARDPDIWVIEIEDTGRKNPFEGKII